MGGGVSVGGVVGGKVDCVGWGWGWEGIILFFSVDE